jgi:8-oxo-dGTP diphosphatase
MIEVTAAIIQDNGKVLICRRNEEKRHGGKWEFPGGKIEDGETPEKCLAREMLEEFNIRVSVGSFFAENIHEYHRGPVRLLAYYVHWLSGRMQLLDHDRTAWVIPHELDAYDLLPADRPFAERLRMLDNQQGIGGSGVANS